jgi:sulfur-carrier protein
MKVGIPSILHSYTKARSEVEARGSTLAAVLADLDRQFPGLRFRVVDEQDRIRPHILFYVAGKRARDLSQPVTEVDEVRIIGALSGG